MLNNNGPRIEPCGTPVLINHKDNFAIPIFTYCFQSDR